MLDRAGVLFRWVAGAVVPMFARPVSPVGLAWFVHFVLVSGLAVGLFFAQRSLDLNQNISRGPVAFRPFWLPALFVLVYLLCWSAVWLWRALVAEPGDAEYPKLDAAWEEIGAALEKAGIGLADTPVFLVFGDFPAGFDVLFRGLPGGLVVAGGSAPGSPLRAYANRDGIYLTVPGASLLGADTGAPADGEPRAEIPGLEQTIGVGQSGSLDVSLGASIGASLLSADLSRTRAPVAAAPPAKGPARGSVLTNPTQREDGRARLTHVCGLIAAARWPLCPVNGAIVVVPAQVADRDDAQQWGLVAQADLANATAALKLRFPVFALIGGLEASDGGARFFHRLAVEFGDKRLGKGFPLNPDLPPGTATDEIEKSVAWVFGRLLPEHLFRQMRVDATVDMTQTENAALFRFLAEVRRRGPRLARLVSRAVTDGPEPPVYGGCYLAVVEGAEVPFAKDFFRSRVLKFQSAVAWTDAAYDEDASYRSGARMGYIVLALIWVGVIALAIYTGYVQFGTRR